MNTNIIVNETLEEVADIFTNYSDIPFTKDPIINQQMRVIMLQNMQLLELTHHLLYSKPGENESLLFDFIRMTSNGWFNYDRYTNQFAEHEIDEIITFFISEVILKKSVEYKLASLNLDCWNI